MTAKVGRYQLKTKGIASGANGSVHEAVNVDNGNLVSNVVFVCSLHFSLVAVVHLIQGQIYG